MKKNDFEEIDKNDFVKYKKNQGSVKSFYCLNLLVLNQPVYFLSVRGNL